MRRAGQVFRTVGPPSSCLPPGTFTYTYIYIGWLVVVASAGFSWYLGALFLTYRVRAHARRLYMYIYIYIHSREMHGKRYNVWA